MNLYASLAVVLLFSMVTGASCTDTPRTTTLKFDQGGRPENWTVNFGSWEVSEGKLVARQLEEEKHAAASRLHIPFSDGVVKLKVRMQDAKLFHIGFDPLKGELKKKGHLYTLILTDTHAIIKKHRDKDDAKSTDEVLASKKFAAAEWIVVELRTEGDTVTVKIGGAALLEVTDPTFHVAKPAVVFRAVGEALVDDVEVTVLKN